MCSIAYCASCLCMCSCIWELDCFQCMCACTVGETSEERLSLRLWKSRWPRRQRLCRPTTVGSFSLFLIMTLSLTMILRLRLRLRLLLMLMLVLTMAVVYSSCVRRPRSPNLSPIKYVLLVNVLEYVWSVHSCRWLNNKFLPSLFVDCRRPAPNPARRPSAVQCHSVLQQTASSLYCIEILLRSGNYAAFSFL